MTPHGTPSRYRHNGCRCRPCTDAAAQQTLELNRRKRLAAGPNAEQAEAIRGLPGETWRPVDGFDGYEVSNLGRVRSVKMTYPRILSTSLNRDGYVKVFLWQGNKSHYRYVHALVAGAFHGPRPDGLEVRHLNDDKNDNRAANLRYGTRSENINDAVRNGKWFQSLKTHCPQGHPYDEANTIVRKQGWRACRTCAQNRRRAA